jgi:hypothetical protein
MKKQKPFFSKEQLDKLVEVFTATMTIDGRQYDDKMIAAFTKYVQSPKNEYENAILSHVIDGKYVVAIVQGQMAYKVTPPPKGVELSKSEIEKLNKATADLTHAMNMITLYGKPLKLEL